MKDCYFYENEQCRALHIPKCQGKCSFYKTSSQFFEGQKAAEERLISLGLKTIVIKLPDDTLIMSTYKADLHNPVNRKESEVKTKCQIT